MKKDMIQINRKTFLDICAAASGAREWMATQAPASDWANKVRAALHDAICAAVAEPPGDLSPTLLDADFVAEVEKHHFRTDQDTGANANAMFIWNLVRKHVELPELTRADLPSYCEAHNVYHVLKPDYGCAASLRKEHRAPINRSEPPALGFVIKGGS